MMKNRSMWVLSALVLAPSLWASDSALPGETSTVWSLTSGQKHFAVNLGSVLPLTDLDLTGKGDVLGAGLWPGGKDRSGKPGLLISTNLLYDLRPGIAVGGELGFANTKPYMSGKLATGFDAEPYVETKYAMALVRVTGGAGRNHPYAAAGLGIEKTRVRVNVMAPPNSVWVINGQRELPIYDSAQTAMVYSLRGGTEVDVMKGGSIGVEVGWMRIGRQTYDGRYGFTNLTTTFNMATVSGRFAYRFGTD